MKLKEIYQIILSCQKKDVPLYRKTKTTSLTNKKRVMGKNVIHYGKVSFADVSVGSIVSVVDYYDNVAVGIVEEKIEAISKKTVTVRMGFEETISVIIDENEENCDNGKQYYQLVSIIRSYV